MFLQIYKLCSCTVVVCWYGQSRCSLIRNISWVIVWLLHGAEAFLIAPQLRENKWKFPTGLWRLGWYFLVNSWWSFLWSSSGLGTQIPKWPGTSPRVTWWSGSQSGRREKEGRVLEGRTTARNLITHCKFSQSPGDIKFNGGLWSF